MQYKDRDNCTFTGVDAYTESKGRYAPSKKEEDTSEAFKDSKEYQEKKAKSYDGELIFYDGRLWLG
tara:strand:+ start:195 stop:392 length:198 start_codon:yes stop_codon:yes gene_type:complete